MALAVFFGVAVDFGAVLCAAAGFVFLGPSLGAFLFGASDMAAIEFGELNCLHRNFFEGVRPECIKWLVAGDSYVIASRHENQGILPTRLHSNLEE